MTLRELIKNKFNGDRKLAANAAGISIFHLNNNIDREAIELKNGNYLVTRKDSIIFEVKNEND